MTWAAEPGRPLAYPPHEPPLTASAARYVLSFVFRSAEFAYWMRDALLYKSVAILVMTHLYFRGALCVARGGGGATAFSTAATSSPAVSTGTATARASQPGSSTMAR